MQASSSSVLEPDTVAMSDDQPPSYLLPYTTLQPTYHQVYTDILDAKVTAENVWLSVYAENAPMKSIHCTIALAAQENDNINQKNQVTVQAIKGARNLLLKEERIKGSLDTNPSPVPDLSISTSSSSLTSTSPTVAQNSPSISSPVRLRLPIYTTSRLLNGRRSQRAIDLGGGGQISAFDVSPDGVRMVAGGEDGECVVAGLPPWVRGSTVTKSGDRKATHSPSEISIEERAQQRIQEREKERLACLRLPLAGHVGDIQSATFFPSSLVVLSASSDLTMRLFSAQDGICPRIFRGHKRAITSTAILGRGKRVVSAALDGTIRVWDVRTGKSVRTIACRGWSGIESLKITRLGADSPDQLDEGLGDYVLFAGLSSGYVQVLLLRIEQPETQTPTPQNDLDTSEEEALPHETVRITEWTILEIAPRSWPTSMPGASDFWKFEASTGSIWSLDVAQVGVPNSEDDDGSALNLLTGSKSGILRFFQLQVKRTGAAVSDAQVGDETGSEPPLSLSCKEVMSLKRNSASIHSLRFISSPSSSTLLRPTASDVPPDVVVATGDGTPFRLSFTGITSTSSESVSSTHRIEPVVKEEYTGWEAGEAVHGIAVVRAGEGDGERILLAGAEGVVRIY